MACRLVAEGGTGGRPASGPLSRAPRSGPRWRLRDRSLDLEAPVVMGILNLTPDSFSDGGELASLDAARDRARDLAEAGAGILDVGGESTRPGAEPISIQEEMDRILPFLDAVSRELDLPLSVDTRRAEVAREAIRLGAAIVNDVSGLGHDPDMAGVVAATGVGVVVSHMRGSPATMRAKAVYADVVGEVVQELAGALARAWEAGVERERVVVDPGIGFAKTGEQSLLLLRELREMGSLGLPVLVGPSRKSFLGEITGLPPRERVPGTVAACVMAYLNGARVFRVHDVPPVVQALAVARAIVEGRIQVEGGRGR